MADAARSMLEIIALGPTIQPGTHTRNMGGTAQPVQRNSGDATGPQLVTCTNNRNRPRKTAGKGHVHSDHQNTLMPRSKGSALHL